MKNKMFGLMLAGAMLVATPFAALAADRGGERGHSGGGNSYAEGARGGEHFNGEHFNGGHDFDRRDRDDRDGYRGGVYFSAGAPVYGYTAPNPCGYYDAAGYWHADPACYVPPAAY